MTTIDTINKTSKFVRHIPCKLCGSKDNRALYQHPNGRTHSWCFKCEDLITNDTNEETMITPAKEINKEFLEGEYDNLLKRTEDLEKKLHQFEKDINIAAKHIEKMSEMLADISVIQKVHVEQTANLQAEIDNLLAVLFPKDDIKFDLMNEPYN